MNSKFIFLFALASASVANLYAAEDSCRPRALKVGDSIISTNGSRVGRVTEVNPDGFIKMRGIPWPTENFYRPDRFCLFLPKDTHGEFKSGDTVVEISNGHMAHVHKIKNFSENGYIGFVDYLLGTNYRHFNSGPYKHIPYQPVQVFNQFKIGSCVVRVQRDATTIEPKRSFKVIDILAQGYIRTNEPFTDYYLRASDYLIDGENGCLGLFDKWF